MTNFDFSDFVVTTQPAQDPNESASVVNPSSDNGRSFLRESREAGTTQDRESR